MLSGVVDIVLLIAGVALGTALGLWAMHYTRQNRRGFAVASALLMSFAFINPKAEMVQEAADTTKRKRDAQSGEPPTTGDEDSGGIT